MLETNVRNIDFLFKLEMLLFYTFYPIKTATFHLVNQL